VNDYGDHRNSPTEAYRAQVAYITGSHALKGGLSLVRGVFRSGGSPNPVRYQFRNGMPVGIDQVAAPSAAETRLKYNLGIYGQDQWTVRRLTLNLGLRIDLLNEYNPAQTRPAGVFLPEVRFDPVYNVPNWKDINPRLGAVYDLFGTGRTALKVSLNRYPAIEAVKVGDENNPVFALAASTSRTWNDGNGNYTPDCDLVSRVANGECGAMNNRNFGTTVINRRYGTDALEGWDARNYMWQTMASVSHELWPGFGVDLSYFRVQHGNFRVIRNLAVTVADFDPFCVTAPVDARLPGGGGNQICGFYDLKPEKFGQSNLLVTKHSSENVPISRVYNGIEATMRARFGQGGFVSGGIATGRLIPDICSLKDRPDLQLDTWTMRSQESPLPNQPFCRVTPPLSAATQVKFTASYPLPWGVQASAVFQNLPGIEAGATFVATNAAVVPSLGRNLGACGTAAVCNATVIVPLVAPGTMYEPRQTQVDLRLSKDVRLPQGRLRPRIEFHNLFNANSVQAVNTRYGPSWLQPGDNLNGRMVKVGAQLDF
jgi:hypothetical protein